MRLLRYLLFTTALLTLPPSVFAQDGQAETLTAAWAPVKVEHHIGLRGGYAMSGIRFEPSRRTEYLNGLIEGGIFYRFDIPQQKYVGTIEFALNVTQKGYRVFESFESNTAYERKYTDITLPIVWQPYLPLHKGGSRLFLSAGPYVSYAVSSSYKSLDVETGQIFEEGDYTYDGARDNRWGYGITFGGGVLIGIRNFSILLEARYNIGLSDIFKGVTKYEGNPFRSPVDQITINLGVAYRLPIGRRETAAE